MTGLKVVWVCPYLTAVEGVIWRPFDHQATKMVKALKGIPFNGYFETGPQGARRRFDNFTALEFHPAIHQIMARAILGRTRGPVTLVPIPNSRVTFVDHPDFKTRALADGIVGFGEGRLTCVPHLVFQEEQTSSHSGGGSRDPNYLEEAYRVEDHPKGQIVLVDDVLTTGGHLIAAYWKLCDLGCSIPLSSAWGRTVDVQREAKFQLVEEELDTNRVTLDLDDFPF